ncbi:MAG: 3-oxoadipyl-CoA thiolase [SAR324 cluster bacterium]|nr:3-oxoadipyl-CoA thiolase [SAR324 cluster bacterium]MEC8980571.1 3-oxoadipyl-CoA thiolase [SAR324 cluster bacterium]MEC9383857.1 3-oxoadipyl-CoA thiolase [SAR324 cluster bacterium]MEC9460357.1 3-oxoadipyl-CoA thiolase [SAR324 cluster bacterium]MED5402924.1 3-oxoadipyl-CoA thiolase [SAR324 cluster bacterium]
MEEAFLCDGIRTPVGRYGGALSSVRTDDLGAIPLKTLKERNSGVDWEEVDDVILGCANQAGEDNRNVARMASLLSGLPLNVPGSTVNRLCGSGLDAVGIASRAIKSGDQQLVIAGGVESMSRAPFVMGKACAAFSRNAEIFDTTIGWRFVNKLLQKQYGIDSMPETAENLAKEFNISRKDQDVFAWHSQQKAGQAQESGRLATEIVPVSIAQRKGDPLLVEQDEHPRPETKLEKLGKLSTPFRENGCITAGNASGVNDGAAALIVASEKMAIKQNLTPVARIVGMATAGVEPRIMGYGPVPATQKLLSLTGISLGEIGVIELNEAFAAQAIAVMRALKLSDDDGRVNPNGGAIALGHPLGMSGARLALTAMRELQLSKERFALCTMCIGVGQGISMLIERV